MVLIIKISMISTARRAKHRPLKSPDPDYQNRSVILSTKSPDVKHRTSHVPVAPTLQLQSLRNENRQLKRQLYQLKSTLQTRLEISKLGKSDLQRRGMVNEQLMRVLGEREKKIDRLERMVRIRTEKEEEMGEGAAVEELKQENVRLRAMLEDSKPSLFLEEHNRSLAQRIEELKKENEALVLENQRSRKYDFSKSKEDYRIRPQAIVKQQQQIHRIKQYFQKQAQLYRDRFYQLCQQLSQAQTRLQQLQKSLPLPHPKKPPTTIKTKQHTPPIARGDSGFIDSCSQQPIVSRFLDTKQDNPSPKIVTALREKDLEIEALRNRVRVLEERANVQRMRWEEGNAEVEELRRELRKKGDEGQEKSNRDQLKEYILSLNATLSIQQRRIIELQDENQKLRRTLQTNFDSLNPKQPYTTSLQQQNTQLRLQLEKLQQQTKTSNSKVSTTGDPQKISSLNYQILSLKQTITALKKTNLQLQMNYQSKKTDMSHRLNSLTEQNQLFRTTTFQLKEQNEQLEERLKETEKELREVMGRFVEYEKGGGRDGTTGTTGTTGTNSITAILAAQREKMIETMVKYETENRDAKGEMQRLREENRLLKRNAQRKGEQLQEVIEELARTKELIQSVSIDSVENRIKINHQIEKDKHKNRQRVVRISIGEKQSLKRQNSILSKRVVSLSDQVIRLGHENQILKAEIQRVIHDSQSTNRKAAQLSETINEYILNNKEEKIYDSIDEGRLQAEIKQRILQLSQPLQMTSIKDSIRRMQHSINKVRSQLQSFCSSPQHQH